jgi:Cdc6-like AAA superfamily ATPase
MTHAKNQKEQVKSELFTDKKKIAEIEGIYVSHPKLEKIWDRMDHCREFSQVAAEPKGMLITGEQGAGKTKLIERYVARFPRVVTPEKTIVPVLVIDVIIPATVKSLVEDLLASLGDPAAGKGTVASQTRRFCEYVKKCETRLIIVDEFQHFKDRESLKVLKTISDWLKVLMNRTKLPIILSGMPNSKDVLDAKGNEQLKRRFTWRERLEPFGWSDVEGEEEQQDDMRKFLVMVEDALAEILPERPGLSGVDMASRIHEATGGNVDKIMKLVRHAAEIALLKGVDVDLDLLAEAYEEQLADNAPEKGNPFRDDADMTEAKIKNAPREPSPSNTSVGDATSKRIRGMKLEPSLSAVLSQ